MRSRRYDAAGTYIALGTNTGGIGVIHSDKFNLKPECEVWDAAGDESAGITSVAFSPDNSMLACRADNGTISVYVRSERKEIRELRRDKHA